MLLAGILIGFIAFSAISLIYSGSRIQDGGGGIPKEIEFDFLVTSEKQGWIEEVTPVFKEWFKDRFGITISVRLIVLGTHDTVSDDRDIGEEFADYLIASLHKLRQDHA